MIDRASLVRSKFVKRAGCKSHTCVGAVCHALQVSHTIAPILAVEIYTLNIVREF
jgi:hypothetical protein